MAYTYNRVILIGNLTRDPEVKYLQSGTAVCEVAVALNDRMKDSSGQWVDRVSYVDVTFWARSAEIAGEYLRKGSPVFVEGRLQQDTWESQDGQKRSKLRVICERLQLVGGRNEGGGGGSGMNSATSGQVGGRGGPGYGGPGYQNRRGGPQGPDSPVSGTSTSGGYGGPDQSGSGFGGGSLGGSGYGGSSGNDFGDPDPTSGDVPF
ncbi:MAG: single-stranded DNA-binding protein [Planctomycetia bacterium]|nr:single-stranded DNA-binding protein [Planctomycetia bacterium]